MGDVLAELEDLLRSKPYKDKITSGEYTILQTCKARAIRAFMVGSCVTSIATWAATRSLTHGQRFNLTVGSAMLTGMWRFNRSLNACLEQILGFEGSRMQRELASIILAKHQDNASRVQLVRKYFYPELVFNDLNPDKPFYRWRTRNFFGDNTAVQRTEEAEDSNYDEKPDDIQPKKFFRNPGGGMTAQRNPCGEVIADPLDCIFGDQDKGQEITHSDKASALPRRRLRAHKRAHRRRHYTAETSADLKF